MDPLARDRIEALLRHGAFVRRMARALVRDPDRADDVVQETWVTALVHPPRSVEATLPWLSAVTRNVARNLVRGECRRRRREEAVRGPEPLAEPVDRLLERLQVQRDVVDGLLALSEPCRTALVMRWQDDLPPREIARRLGVPVQTVKARLRRGLARLRAALDDRYGGDRPAWCGALACLVRLPEPAVPNALLGGSLMMGAKTLLLAAAATLVTVTVSWLVGQGPSTEPTPSTTARARLGQGPAIPHATGTARAARGTPLAPVRQEAAAESALPATATAPSTIAEELPPPGTVVFLPWDAVTGRPVLSDVEARFLHPTRFAEVRRTPDADQPISVQLTVGEYQGTVRANGYEAEPLGSFQVCSDGTTDLGRIHLRRGRGRIEGRVLGVPDGVTATVKLTGAGRGPCPACATGMAPDSGEEDGPCMSCGRDDGVSIRSLANGDPFAFSLLAAGGYRLRVECDRDEVTAFDEGVALERDGVRFLDVRLSPSARATFELFHADGLALPDVWRGDPGAVLSFTFHRPDDPQPVTVFRYSPSMVNGLLETFVGDRTIHATSIQVSGLASLLVNLPQERDERADRPRTPDDALWPAADVPPRPSAGATTMRKEIGTTFTLYPLPAERLEVRVDRGDWTSDRIPVDLRQDGTRWRVPVRPRREDEQRREVRIRGGGHLVHEVRVTLPGEQGPSFEVRTGSQ